MNTKVRKPMLAEDVVESKLRFPLIAMPKIDGVRGWNPHGTLLGRSLKQHANVHVTKLLSYKAFAGIDGELAEGSATSPTLCRDTTSLMNSIDKQPQNLTWFAFDYITERTAGLTYQSRVHYLQEAIDKLGHLGIKPVHPMVGVKSLEELQTWETKWLDMGYEGVIVRDPNGRHKEGRSTPTEGGLLRIKRFVEEEGVVVRVLEGNANTNPAKLNELGKTERSTHKAFMVPNGMVGTMVVEMLKTGQVVDVAPGCMTLAERIECWKDQSLIVGHVIKVKSFPVGVKDKPRFPTFQSRRAPSDM